MEKVVSPFDYDAKIILDLCKFVLLQLQFFFLIKSVLFYKTSAAASIYLHVYSTFFYNNSLTILHVLASREQRDIFIVF